MVRSTKGHSQQRRATHILCTSGVSSATIGELQTPIGKFFRQDGRHVLLRVLEPCGPSNIVSYLMCPNTCALEDLMTATLVTRLDLLSGP